MKAVGTAAVLVVAIFIVAGFIAWLLDRQDDDR